LSFRNLSEPGGPASRPRSRGGAASYKYKEANDQGDMVERNGRPRITFPPPSLASPMQPPDLSVIVKARGYERGFPGFLVECFTQYQEQRCRLRGRAAEGLRNGPAGFELPAWRDVQQILFPNHAIAMPPPLSDGRVSYTDGRRPRLISRRGTSPHSLAWAAEPHLEARKACGHAVMIFLIVLSGLLYFTKKKVWRAVSGHA